MFYRFILLLVAFFMVLVPLHAQEGVRYHQVSLQAGAEREIVPDRMRITLYSEARDANAARLAHATTKILNEAIEKARLVKGVSIQSGNRSAYRATDKKLPIWQERAELHLESSDFVALAALSEDLMGDLKIAGHYFFISKSRLREIENQLIEEAIAAFQERAQIITTSLGGRGYKIKQLNLDDQNGVRPLMLARNMDRVMASPQSDQMPAQIEAGTSEVAIIAQGLIEVEM